MNPVGAGIVRQLVWELRTNSRLCLQTTLHLYTLRSKEKSVLGGYFDQKGLLKQGRFGEFIDHIQALLRRTPVPLLASAGMVDEIRPHLGAVRQDDLEKALELASAYGRLEVVKLLVPTIAAHNRQKFLKSSFDTACYVGQLDIAEYLLTQGVRGTSKLLAAAVVANESGLVQRMLDKGACPVHKLRQAAINGHLQNLKLLLAAAPHKDCSHKPCNKYWYIEDAAAYARCPEVLSELLLAMGNRTIAYHTMALTAAEEGNLMVLHYLANAKTSTCQRPVLAFPEEVAMAACSKGRVEAAKFLLNQYPELQPQKLLVTGACSGHPALVELLLTRAAPVSVSTLNDALVKVAAHSDNNFHKRPILELLTAAGATDLNSALVAAAGCCDFEAVRFLVYQGATAFNEALLQVSKGPDWETIVSFLLDCGADDIEGLLEKYADSSVMVLLRRKGRLVLVRH